MPELERFIKTWKRYVHDTITYIKPDFITNVIYILNKFTYEVENNDKISFLHVLLMRCDGNLKTTVIL